MLAVEPDDQLLEIGGGPGVAASLVCERLDCGSLLLIDRSATATERTRRRNPEHVASGRLVLETVDVGRPRRPTSWLASARHLDRDRRLFLFYETPVPW